MHPYKMIVYAVKSGEKIEYAAEYPAFKYVVGSGSDIPSAILDLESNLSAQLEVLKELNLPIPVSDVFDDPNAYSGKVLLRISKTLHKHMSLRASEEGLSLNAYMAEALSAYTYANRSLFQKRQDPDSLNVHE